MVRVKAAVTHGCWDLAQRCWHGERWKERVLSSLTSPRILYDAVVVVEVYCIFVSRDAKAIGKYYLYLSERGWRAGRGTGTLSVLL